MNAINIEYIPLTFISSLEDKKILIKNSLIMKHIMTQYNDVRPLSELLESTQYGYTASAEDVGTHKFLRITDIQNGFVDWDSVPYCSCDKAEKFLVQRGDILIARTGGTTGKSFLVPDNVPSDVVFASYLIKLRTKNDMLLPEYLQLFLNSYLYWSQISEMKSGSAQPNVNAEKLKMLQIPYCNVDTQKEVIEVFTKNSYFDKKFRNLQKDIQNVLEKMDTLNEVDILIQEQLNLVSAYRSSVLMQAVQGKLVEQDPNDEPAAELLKRIREEKERLIKEKKIKKEKPLPPISPEEIPYELPKGWEWVRLGELVSKLGAGKTPKGGDTNYQSSGIKFIRSQNVWNDGLVLDDIAYISEEINETMRGSIVHPEDILLNITGASIGRSCLLPDDFDTGNVNQHVAIIRLIKPELRFYIHKCIISPLFQNRIMDVQVGISREGLSMSKLAHFIVPLPPMNEQKRIIEKIDTLFKICKSLEISIKKAQKDVQLLLQKTLQELI